MRFLTKTINGADKKILEVNIYDDNDISEIKLRYSTYEFIQMDMNSLQYLELFQNISTLILTGGMPLLEDFQYLYKQKQLDTLVLDFEETDSDEDGIDLYYFPNLKYVLSRSNLNIHNYEEYRHENICIRILNFYKKGKKVKVSYAPNYDLFQKKKFLFFSTEAKSPASIMLMQILKSIEDKFQEYFQDVMYSCLLDSIAIIPSCFPDDMLQKGFGKERKLVSIKRREADIRLQISYTEFILGDDMKRKMLCKENIEKAAKYISVKDKTFELEKFLGAVNFIFEELF